MITKSNSKTNGLPRDRVNTNNESGSLAPTFQIYYNQGVCQ